MRNAPILVFTSRGVGFITITRPEPGSCIGGIRMATVLLVTTWIVSVSATRYADYSQVKMPVYGGNDYDNRDAGRLVADDYQGHSVDAPASLDYKYEEESREDNVKSDEPITIPDDELWHIPPRKDRTVHVLNTDRFEKLNSYNLDIEDVPKIRTNRINIKHRPRLKHRQLKRKEVSNRRQYKYDEKEEGDIDDKEYLDIDTTSDIYRKKKSKKHTTERIIRRKPRDRYVKSPTDVDPELEELAARRRIQSQVQDYDYKLASEDMQDLSVMSTRAPKERFRVGIDEERENVHSSVDNHKLQVKHKGKTYEDYNDYYDMKRVNNIKNKLPVLLRRTTVSESSSTSEQPYHLEESLRRVLHPLDTTRDTTTSSTEIRTESTTRSTTKTTTTPTETSKQSEKRDDLSLAEKSRLSILKKAQRKERTWEGTTTKPPVLLQVTKKIVTVVVVEPGTSQRPWMRVREVPEDSPETIRQVKLLMRKKLIAQAKNIEDLNEDWDKTICDYVDMSLIKIKSSARNHVSDKLVLIIILYLFIVQYIPDPLRV